ncbi:hypothetical protein AC1031_021356 [Aphanomyces cochlioides]|nr:hypothetical protein AC1031_021356 [Aphanomyces cochlioides]
MSRGAFVKIDDVVEENGEGEGNVLVQIVRLERKVEGRQPLIFWWEKVDKFKAIHAAQVADPKPPPPPFPVPPNVTVHDFNIALMEFAKRPNGFERIGTTALPGTQGQLGQCAAVLAQLDVHPWTQHILAQGGDDIVPIATLWTPKKLRSDLLESAMIADENSLWA